MLDNFILSGLASHLVHEGLLLEEKAIEAVQHAKALNLPLISYLVENKILNSSAILHSFAQTFNLPIIDLDNYDSEITEIINPELLRRFRLIPLKKQNGILFLGLADPTDIAAIDAIIFHSGMRVSLNLVAYEQLEKFIDNYCNHPTHNKHLELQFSNQLSLDEAIRSVQEDKVIYEEPLIKFVDNILHHALQKAASDIHIEPSSQSCRIRYRQDGILYEITETTMNLAARLITRLKVMASLDIAERRLPQDGRFQLQHNKKNVDIRLNTCPTIFGEKIALRILDPKKTSLEIDALGLTNEQKNIFLKIISNPQGMLLVTGPTGSGKTVTLYSALHHLNTIEKNISTVEDPVEIQLPGINQVNINPKIGLDFSMVLKTFLRQDPDIIMLGEIRDSETAKIAVQAAQTGHMVLSTLHANSAIATLTRLQSMGIATYDLANSISLIIAQRLVRTLCSHCKEEETIPSHIIKQFNITKHFIAYRAKGCKRCISGFQGRRGIYELLLITDDLANLFIEGATPNLISLQLQRQGFSSLYQMGMKCVVDGITSLSEISRVIHE